MQRTADFFKLYKHLRFHITGNLNIVPEFPAPSPVVQKQRRKNRQHKQNPYVAAYMQPAHYIFCSGKYQHPDIILSLKPHSVRKKRRHIAHRQDIQKTDPAQQYINHTGIHQHKKAP